MPKYQIDVPGSGTFEVESPSDLTDAQAYQAVLGQIKNTPKPEGGIMGAAKLGTKSLLSSQLTGIKSLFGDASQAAQEGIARQEQLGEQYVAPTSLEAVKKAYAEKGLLSAAGEVASQIPKAIAQQAPQLAETFAGAGAGAMVAGPFGAVVGAAIPNLVQFFGANLERQAQEQIKSGQPVNVEAGKAALAAIPQTAVDLVETRLLFGSKFLSGALGVSEKSLTKMSTEAVEKQAQEKLLPLILKGTAKGAATEIPSEIAQQMLERAQAGLPLTSPDAVAEYGNTAYQVGLLGPLGTVGRAGARGEARQELGKREGIAAAEAAITAEQARTAAPLPPDETGQMGLNLQGGIEAAGPRQQMPIAQEQPLVGPEQPSPQMELDFEQPYPKSRLTEPTILGQEEAKAPQISELDLAKMRLEAGAPLTPTQQLLLQEDKAQQRSLFEATPAPELEIPNVVGAGARPTSYVVDDRAIDSFGVTKAATKFKEAVRGLDLMNPEDAAKFDDLVAKHERKNAKINMDAVEAFKAEKPEPVAAREVPEKAGIPAKPYDARKAYQQAREAQFAFGQVAAPLSPKDVRAQAKAEYDERTGAGAVNGPTDGGIQLPSTGVQAAEGTAAPAPTGVGSSIGATERPDGGTTPSGEAGTPTVSPLAQMAQQVAPATKPNIRQKAVPRVETKEALEDQLAKEPVSADTEQLLKDLGIEPAPRKPTTYRVAATETNGLTKERVEGIVKAVTDKWKNAPEIRTVQSEMQLPQSIQNQIKRDGVRRPEGVWSDQDNCVFLIAGNIANAQNAVLTIAHETTGHFGIRGILGDKYLVTMNRIYEGNPEVRALADNKIDRGMDPATAVEEVLAEFAENTPNPTVMQRIINIIRQAFASVGFPMQGVTNGEIKQLLKDARQFVIEGKGGAKAAGTKIGQVYSADGPLFYSRLGAMVQHAPKELSKGATGKQWANWINSNAGKFGVKKEELEWTGVNDLLGLMDDSAKLSTTDVANFIKDAGVKVGEESFGGRKNQLAFDELRKDEDKLTNEAYKLTEEMLDKDVFFEGTYYDKLAKGYKKKKAGPHKDWELTFYTEPLHVQMLEERFDTSSFKPDLEDEYTAKVDAINYRLRNIYQLQKEAYAGDTRYEAYKTPGGENYGELVLTLPGNLKYEHPHWPGVDNPIAHVRFQEFSDVDGKRVLFVEEMQSDWGQQGAKEGFGGKPLTAEAHRIAIEREASTLVALNQAIRKAVEDGRMAAANDVYPPDIEALLEEAQQAATEAHRARHYKTAPKAPFVTDTKSWTALAVKRMFRYAADNDIDRIAFINGADAHKRFEKSHEGESTEKGMATYYDQILPSVVKDVLKKLGHTGGLTTVGIEGRTSQPGYYVLGADGSMEAGPFETKNEAHDAAGHDLNAPEPSDVYHQVHYIEGYPYVDRYIGVDLAPETAAKVKEGQALFREARTPEGKSAESLMSAFGGKPQEQERSFLEKKMGSFNKAKDAWTDSYKQNNDWVASTFGKGQNIASFDQAFNNRIYNYAMGETKKGNLSFENAKKALLRISTSQALHRGNLANQIIELGDYKYDPVVNRWEAVDSKDGVSMAKFEGLIKSLATKLGVEPNRARQIMGAAYEANRLNDMYKSLDKAEKDVALLESELSSLRKNRKRTKEDQKVIDLREARLAQRKKDVEDLNGKVQHKTKAQVDAGMELYKSFPEIEQGTKVWNTMRERVVKMLVETGVKTEDQAEQWLDEAAYVPFFRDMEEQKQAGPQVMARGLRESMVDHRMKGSMKEVQDPIENMYQWMQWSISRAISNKQLQVMIEQYKSVLPEEVREGEGGAGNTFTIYYDGQQRKFNVADPAIAQAFVGLEPIVFPGIGAAVKATNALRHIITRFPIFSAVQLFSDSYTAMYTSGLKSPFGVLKEIAKEVAATAQGTSETRAMLKRAGILETHDYSAMNEEDAIAKRLDLNTPSGYTKLMSNLDRLSSASDNVIRQGIYNQAIKEGLSHAEAMEKAAEIVNFRRISGDPRLQFAGRVIPFFNAYLQVGSVALKTLTGRGISPQERKAAQATLIATSAKIAVLSLLYSMAVGDDEDYKRKNRVTRDRMFMIPGTGGYGIPIRADVFALPKIIGEYSYQMMADNGTTDPKMFKEAMSRAVMNSLHPPSEGIPQIVRPALGVMTNHDFFQDREIVNATMRRLDTDRQFTKNTSEMAKALGALTGMSPLNIDYLLRGYFGSAMTLTAMATNDAINTARGGPPLPAKSAKEMIAGLPNMSGFISKDENTAVLSDFYEVARDVNKASATLKSMKHLPMEEQRAYRQEHKAELRLKPMVQTLEKQLVLLKQREQRVRENLKMTDDIKRIELDKINAQRDRMVKNVTKLRQKMYD